MLCPTFAPPETSEASVATTICTVAARDKLKVRREPYWSRITSGCQLGYRKMSASTPGTWIAKRREQETGHRDKRSLGDFADLPASQRYDAAKKAAEEWFAHLGRGGTAEAVTVKTACTNYVQHVRDMRGDRPANDLDMRFKRWVYQDALARVELGKLTKPKMETWRKSLAKTPVVVNRDKRAEPLTRPRTASSVNRDISALRAALNYAHDAGQATSDMAWRVALRPAKNADGRRDVYLDQEERKSLVYKAPADLALLLRGLSLVPLRPGALAALTTGNFDKRLGVLTIGKDKAGKDRRIKLPAATSAFFAEQAKNKLPTAPLFAQTGGKAWNKDDWKRPIKEAAAGAKLPPNTTAYALRHSVITDLVTGGLDLLTVAQLSGTSVVMIERHYGHLRADHAAAALASLAI